MACALTVACLTLGYVVVRERVIVVPPVVTDAYEVGASFGNREYLTDITRMVLDKLATTTPETVDANNAFVLKVVDPSAYPQLKTELELAAARVKRERITTIWIPLTYSVDVAAHQVRVDGRIKTWISNAYTSERARSYVVSYHISTFGRLYVENVEEVIDDPDARA